MNEKRNLAPLLGERNFERSEATAWVKGCAPNKFVCSGWMASSESLRLILSFVVVMERGFEGTVWFKRWEKGRSIALSKGQSVMSGWSRQHPLDRS